MLKCLMCKQLLEERFFNKRQKSSHRKRLEHTCRICRKAARIRLRGSKYGKIETITWKECWDIYNIFHGQCFNCGTKETLTLDHHNNDKPLVFGNGVLLCNRCNASKRQKKPDEFYSATQLKELVFQYKIEPI